MFRVALPRRFPARSKTPARALPVPTSTPMTKSLMPVCVAVMLRLSRAVARLCVGNGSANEIPLQNSSALLGSVVPIWLCRLRRVDVVQGDCVSTLKTLDVDWSSTLVFADPPWGGRHYEDCQDVDSEQGVHLKGSGTLDGFVETVAGLGCRRLLLKVPHTFDAARFSVNTVVARCDARAVADKVQLVALELRLPGKRPAPSEASSSSKRKKRRKKKKRASKES